MKPRQSKFKHEMVRTHRLLVLGKKFEDSKKLEDEYEVPKNISTPKNKHPKEQKA
jgi:hypothetical protein